MTVTWKTTNSGTAPTLSGWVDRAYLSTTSQVTASSLLLGEVSQSGPLAHRAERHGLGQRDDPAGRQGTTRSSSSLTN